MIRRSISILQALVFAALFVPCIALAQSRGFLWEVQGTDCTVWLLGSIHVADASLYPLSPEIENAWERSEVLAVEADITAPITPEAETLLAQAVYPAGQSLRDDLSSETIQAFKAQGFDLEPFMHMRPWFAIMAAGQAKFAELGMDPSHGVDLHFIQRAHEQGREIKELEGMATQLGDMSRLADSDPDGFVRYMLEDLDRLEEDLSEFLSAWKQGDERRMAERLFRQLREDPASRPFYEMLFFERNERMTKVIEQYLGSGRDHLVIVGSGHLLGERSIVELLRAAGYQMRRL